MDFFQSILIFVFIPTLISIMIIMVRVRARFNRGDPTIWERSIRKFEKEDGINAPPMESILFTGSSSIVYWKTLQEDMSPLPVINRGFGGSRISDVVYYSDRIILPYKPRGIILYAGENDITGLLFSKKRSAAEVLDAFRVFCKNIHESISDVPIYFISIKPPKRRKRLWPEMQNANTMIEQFCDSDERLHYIDICPSMLDDDGNTQGDLFKWDGIHMNAKGYAIWSRIVKPVLLDAF